MYEEEQPKDEDLKDVTPEPTTEVSKPKSKTDGFETVVVKGNNFQVYEKDGLYVIKRGDEYIGETKEQSGVINIINKFCFGSSGAR